MVDDQAATDVLANAPALQVGSAVLHVVRGPDAGTTCRLDRGATKIGTGAGNQLRLTDATVSRMHCELEASREGLRVLDLDSTNGTFVDGVRVEAARLVPGSTLALGGTTIRVETSETSVHIELSRRESFGDVLGVSTEMRRIFAVLERVAATDSTVLVEGETGTGKELLAHAIHAASRRASGPFVTIDCGAVTETLVESELFGHVRGAFSGAVGERRGLFEEANGGTLFLDEIGELPSSLQPKLLRALESREVRRVGSNAPRKIDVRIVAATNRPLARSVNEGTFREDLYYRLAVHEVRLPPLRARREDIPRIAQELFTRFGGAGELPRHALEELMARAWPGNVRELRNFIERSVSLGWPGAPRTHGEPQPALSPALEALVPTNAPLKDARLAWIEQFERLYVSALLRRTAGNVTRAAEAAGITRRSLQRMIAQLGIRGPDGKLVGDGEP